jgi:AdoMet-dependent rRNA methyltransferase SPB1
MYKRAAATEKRDVKYVVAKRYNAGKRAKRPAGVKGLYKQVDPRMKKDTGGKRKVATNKRVQKRRLKGRHATPAKQ